MHISSISTARRLLLEFQPGVSQPIQASVGGKVTQLIEYEYVEKARGANGRTLYRLLSDEEGEPEAM